MNKTIRFKKKSNGSSVAEDQEAVHHVPGSSTANVAIFTAFKAFSSTGGPRKG
jgi:hypothetical protein